MTVVSVSIPTILDEQVKALVRTGLYENKSEIFRTALRAFLEENRDFRIPVAMEMYKEGKIDLSMAAVVAGIPYEQLREIFLENGIEIHTCPAIEKTE